MMKNDLVKIMSLSDVAVFMGVSRVTLYKKIRKNEFPPAIAIGLSKGWTKDYIEAFYEARREAQIEIAKELGLKSVSNKANFYRPSL